MTEGYYMGDDIRKDGLLKIKKLRERDTIANQKTARRQKACSCGRWRRIEGICAQHGCPHYSLVKK